MQRFLSHWPRSHMASLKGIWRSSVAAVSLQFRRGARLMTMQRDTHFESILLSITVILAVLLLLRVVALGPGLLQAASVALVAGLAPAFRTRHRDLVFKTSAIY